jgi:YidC/Oxa1 family membrane protein insertase
LYQKAYAMLGEDKEEYDVDDQAEISYSGTTKWISTRNKYFALFIIPLAEDGVSARFSGMNITESDHIVNRLYSIGLGMKFSPGKAQDFKLYIGPTDYTLLASYEENLNVIVEWGWAIFRPFTKAIFYTFRFLYDVIPNYGWVIIVFALLVKLLLWPLTHKSYVGMQKMKEVMPRQKALQEKYKGNPTKLQQEMMKLYKEVGYNPLSGCLPMLIQIPILFPIYQVFRESIDLRQAPWFGWIHDLSLPDTIYIARTGLPLIGDFNINPLPIIMTILTFVQQKVAPMTPMGDTTDPAQRFNQKFMMYGMPILFYFLFNNFSSGLVLYWTIFNVLTMVQQLYLTPKPKKA